MSSERIKKIWIHFSEIDVYYLTVGHSVRILYLRLMLTTFFFFTVQESCSELVTLLKKAYKFYMFVSVLSSPKYFILPCVS